MTVCRLAVFDMCSDARPGLTVVVTCALSLAGLGSGVGEVTVAGLCSCPAGFGGAARGVVVANLAAYIVVAHTWCSHWTSQ